MNFVPLRETLMMLPMHYDVLIAGAGPAGSFAAELLAQSGAKVALFDGRPAGEPSFGVVTSASVSAVDDVEAAPGAVPGHIDIVW